MPESSLFSSFLMNFKKIMRCARIAPLSFRIDRAGAIAILSFAREGDSCWRETIYWR